MYKMTLKLIKATLKRISARSAKKSVVLVDSKCEECEYKASEEGYTIHIMNNHEPKDVFEHFWLVWIDDNIKDISRTLSTLKIATTFKSGKTSCLLC